MNQKTSQDYFQIELENQENVIIPLENTIEVIRVAPHQVCPIPGVKETILGVNNYQGKLLWIVSLSPQTTNNSKKNLTVIVLKIKGQFLGLVVSKLKGVITLKNNQFNLDGEIFKLLDLEKIVPSQDLRKKEKVSL